MNFVESLAPAVVRQIATAFYDSANLRKDRTISEAPDDVIITLIANGAFARLFRFLWIDTKVDAMERVAMGKTLEMLRQKGIDTNSKEFMPAVEKLTLKMALIDGESWPWMKNYVLNGKYLESKK